MQIIQQYFQISVCVIIKVTGYPLINFTGAIFIVLKSSLLVLCIKWSRHCLQSTEMQRPTHKCFACALCVRVPLTSTREYTLRVNSTRIFHSQVLVSGMLCSRLHRVRVLNTDVAYEGSLACSYVLQVLDTIVYSCAITQ